MKYFPAILSMAVVSIAYCQEPETSTRPSKTVGTWKGVFEFDTGSGLQEAGTETVEITASFDGRVFVVKDYVEAKVFGFPFEMEQLMLWRETKDGYDVEVFRTTNLNQKIERQNWKSEIVGEQVLRTMTKGPQGEPTRVTETFASDGSSVMIGEVEVDGEWKTKWKTALLPEKFDR